MLSSFYVTTEQASEALRLATQAVQLAPDLAEAHQGLGRALHISLRLDEAAAEYKRALELDPNSKTARRSLADLNRALGKSEEALALYRQQLEAEPADKAARAGLILSLFDLGRKDEAKPELDKALAADPRNLSLLAGAAYWFAAHNDSEQALDLAARAVQIEPRYTWSQIALARALVAQRKPLEAERALRFARQYGKFPTLDYELASTLVSAGLYDEAAEVLRQSFSIKGRPDRNSTCRTVRLCITQISSNCWRRSDEQVFFSSLPPIPRTTQEFSKRSWLLLLPSIQESSGEAVSEEGQSPPRRRLPPETTTRGFTVNSTLPAVYCKKELASRLPMNSLKRREAALTPD